MGWLFTDFFLVWKNGDKDYSFFTWASIDNPYFPKETYESEKRKLPPEEFARRYMGEFKKMSGLIYDLPKEQIIAPIENLDAKAEVRLMGIDWGFRNPSAISVLYLYDKAWYIVDEWKQEERTTEEILQVANNKITEHRILRVYPDPAQPERLEEARRKGIPMYPANKDVRGGISFLRAAIFEKRFFVYNTCRETLSEMSMYHWMDQKIPTFEKDPKEQPQKFNDHLMDAMRYAIYSYKPQSQVIQQSKPTLPFYGDSEIPF